MKCNCVVQLEPRGIIRPCGSASARAHLTPWASSDICTVALLPNLRYGMPITVFRILINKIQSYFITDDTAHATKA